VYHQPINNIENKVPADRLILPGVVNHQTAKEWIARSSVLLLPINQTKDAQGRIPAKLFEYLSCAKPIVVLGSAEGDAAKIVQETHSGKCFQKGDSKLLAKYLEKIRSQDHHKAIDLESVAQYSRENTAKELYILLKSLI